MRRDVAWVTTIAASMFGLALLASGAYHAPSDAAALLVVYLLIAGAGHTFALGAARLSRFTAWPGAIPLAAVVIWQLRELWMFPFGKRATLLAILAAAGLYALLLRSRWWRGQVRPLSAFAAAAAFALLAAGAVAAGFLGSPVLRWHLLRHHKLVGTPAYYLLADRVGDLCDEMWSDHEPRQIRPPLQAQASDVAVRPSLLFLMVDTLRADGLEFYGGAPDVMPGLNALARRSYLFADVLANATWTRPSVASFFTGLLQESHGAVDRDYALPERRLTLAESLKARGYATAAFVSNFAAVGRAAGFAQGFDHFDEIPKREQAYAPAERVNERVRAWLERSRPPAGQPLFLYVHYLDPHHPHLSGGLPLIETPGGLHHAYELELTRVDRQLAELAEEVTRTLPEPWVVFVTSDHGEEFGEHGEGGHGHSLYREVAQIPALLQTNRQQHAVIRSPLEARDFHDLLLALADEPGLDVAGWSERRARSVRYSSIYASSAAALQRPYKSRVCMRALEKDGWMVLWSAYGPSLRLYDLKRDPDQHRDRSMDEPEITARLAQEMREITGTEWARRDHVQLREDTEAQLRALGYLE